MSKFEVQYPKGSTPLDPNEIIGLIPDYITTQGELNSLEKENISKAIKWSEGRNHKNLLESSFIFNLHKRMLSDVWRWAGIQRTSDKSIGVDWRHIPSQMKLLLDDTKYWIENDTYLWKEIAARFHHRLLQIQAFPNGNGRHARLMTEILLQQYDQPTPTWGIHKPEDTIDVEGTIRDEYIRSLQEADNKFFNRLIKFMFS
ncbi:MAG: mobile mystery protein B [Pseudobdellovibrionaceae bacterium]|nr:mobile mystery protein B [Bdellovibrionales bacterium]USN46514.1 MAG: mobile mystery protein B [Pseudobdellovibrionaceae bacterium]